MPFLKRSAAFCASTERVGLAGSNTASPTYFFGLILLPAGSRVKRAAPFLLLFLEL